MPKATSGGRMVEVFLLEQIGKFSAGSKAKVKKGYAAHYLVPKNKAIYATGNENFMQSRTQEIEEKHSKLNEESNKILQKLKDLFADKPLTLQRASGMRGILYGSISAPNIADELKTKYDISIDRKNIVFNPIKTIGEYFATIRLYGATTFKLNISITGLS